MVKYLLAKEKIRVRFPPLAPPLVTGTAASLVDRHDRASVMEGEVGVVPTLDC